MFVMAFIVILARASTIVELTFCPASLRDYYISNKIHSLKKKKILIKVFVELVY